MPGRTGSKPLEVGQKVRDRSADTEGTIIDCAKQYAHPKAPPVFTYLIRWSDGQVQAVTEAAMGGSHGIEAID